MPASWNYKAGNSLLLSKIEIMFLFGIMRENACSKAGDIF
jgi:hypothetical protein